MKKQILINLFGAAGKRIVEITPRGGFFTRHIKVPRRETASSISAPETNPKSAPVNPEPDEVQPPTLLEALNWMEASENHSGWLIIDEILFVSTTLYKMTFNHNSLLDALRLLFQKGVLEYRLNRFNQHTFRLIDKQKAAPDLKPLLAEVDAIMSEGDKA